MSSSSIQRYIIAPVLCIIAAIAACNLVVPSLDLTRVHDERQTSASPVSSMRSRLSSGDEGRRANQSLASALPGASSIRARVPSGKARDTVHRLSASASRISSVRVGESSGDGARNAIHPSSTSPSIPSPTPSSTIPIAFLCATSPSTYDRGILAYNSWAGLIRQYTTRNSTFTFVSNAELPCTNDGTVNCPTWTNPDPNDRGGYMDAQDRFLAALVGVPMPTQHAGGGDGAKVNATWIMMADDDAFVHFLNVERLVETLDPTRPALYGQLGCRPPMNRQGSIKDLLAGGQKFGGSKEHPSWLCGGGGVLLSPALVGAMRGWDQSGRRSSGGRLFSKRKVSDVQHANHKTYYDMHLSWAVTEKGLGELINVPGFHSRPPPEKNHSTSNDPVLTFHYLNGEPSRKFAPMYEQVYETYLAEEAPRTRGTILLARQSTSNKV